MNKLTQPDNRAIYKFPLEFPPQFTIATLRGITGGHIHDITLRKRVDKALATGDVIVAGRKVTRGVGRSQIVYRRADAKVSTLSAKITILA